MAKGVLIAGIDPGHTTGLAIADMTIKGWEVWLERVDLCGYTNPLDVIARVRRTRCAHVVMEQQPQNGHVPNFEILFEGIQRMGYSLIRHFKFVSMGLSTITPGIWKPVMAAQQLDFRRGHWEPQSAHETDALNMLHYVVRLNHLQKEIKYA